MLLEARQLVRSGQLSRARVLLEEILLAEANHAEALHLSGLVAAMTGALDLAVDLIERAIRIDPLNPALHNDLGVVLKRLRNWGAALIRFDRAIELDPNFAEAHNNRGNVLRELNQLPDAIDSYRQAITLEPEYAEAHHNLGVTLSDLHQWQAAMPYLDRAIALNPGYANAYCNRGFARERLSQPEAALADYDRAITLDRRFTQVYVNRGNVLRELCRPEAAVASCDRALALDPGNAQAHQNRAMALLLMGDYARGWAEFEWRWKNARSALSRDTRSFTQPLWLGAECLADKTILLHAEQGLGDTLQFCRYARLVVERGARVILEVQAPLVELMGTLDASIEVIARGDPLRAFDYQCPLMSLPVAFRTTCATVPAGIPYLHADPIKAHRWRDRLGPRTRPRVGLVWAGGFRADMPETWAAHGRRNIALARLAALRDAPVEFFSLQKGQSGAGELAELVAQRWNGPRIHDVTAELRDFSDTAALIEQLDLVVSVDTSTAHLAGAMGKPVWLLNRFDTCWRWMLGRDDSPWYPTLRLYRQQRLGDWDSVVREVCGALA